MDKISDADKKYLKELVYFKITFYLCTRKSEMMAG